MNRILLLLAALVATFAVACGGDNKDDDRADGTGDERPAATATSAADEASEDEIELDEFDVTDESPTGGGLFGPLVGLGLGGVSGDGPDVLPGAMQGSGDLEQYLLDDGDLPDGYQSMGVLSLRVPEMDDEALPGGEIAVSMWSTDDPATNEIPEGSMLIIGVLQPDDAASIGGFIDECGGVEEQLNEQAGDDASMFGIELSEIETLDSSELGDTACGVGLTIDMSAFFEGFTEGFGELGGEEVPDEVVDALSGFTMRIRMFGEGDKVGMVMQIGFGADAELADDLSIAQELRENLQ